MRSGTEDLLRLRDDEPMDALTRERLLADSRARVELARLRRAREALNALPEVEPPAGVWARIEAAAALPARRPGRRVIVKSAAAACITLGLLAALSGLESTAPPEPRTQRPNVASAAPDTAASGRLEGARAPASGGDADYRRLVQQSIELERLLARVPAPQPVMSLGTAGTIAGLEEQIAYVDTQLALGGAEGWGPRYREALWSERVDLMMALVEMRLAHSRLAAY